MWWPDLNSRVNTALLPGWYKAWGTVTHISLDETQHKQYNYFSNLYVDWFTFLIVVLEYFKLSRECSRWNTWMNYSSKISPKNWSNNILRIKSYQHTHQFLHYADITLKKDLVHSLFHVSHLHSVETKQEIYFKNIVNY